jgi:hypothetical protein
VAERLFIDGMGADLSIVYEQTVAALLAGRTRDAARPRVHGPRRHGEPEVHS